MCQFKQVAEKHYILKLNIKMEYGMGCINHSLAKEGVQ